jgi:hypothetical protein
MMGQGRAKGPKHGMQAPHGRGLGRVALPSFGGLGCHPLKFFYNSNQCIFVHSCSRIYDFSKYLFSIFFFLHEMC